MERTNTLIVAVKPEMFHDCILNPFEMKSGRLIRYYASHKLPRRKVEYLAFYISGTKTIKFYSELLSVEKMKRKELSDWSRSHGKQKHRDFKGDQELYVFILKPVNEMSIPINDVVSYWKYIEL